MALGVLMGRWTGLDLSKSFACGYNHKRFGVFAQQQTSAAAHFIVPSKVASFSVLVLMSRPQMTEVLDVAVYGHQTTNIVFGVVSRRRGPLNFQTIGPRKAFPPAAKTGQPSWPTSVIPSSERSRQTYREIVYIVGKMASEGLPDVARVQV